MEIRLHKVVEETIENFDLSKATLVAEDNGISLIYGKEVIGRIFLRRRGDLVFVNGDNRIKNLLLQLFPESTEPTE